MEVGWWYPKNIGDKIQGTYIGKFETKDQYNNDQIVYKLMQENGSVMQVGVRTGKGPFHKQFDPISFGQIVGILFAGELPGKDGKRATKVLKVIADAKIVNDEWIKSQDRNAAISNKIESEIKEPTMNTGSEITEDDILNAFDSTDKSPATERNDVPFPSSKVEVSKTPQEVLSMIMDLAKVKLGTANDSETKDKVMEITNLAFIPVNYQKILEYLRALNA